MNHQVDKVKKLYIAITFLSVISVVWYVLKIIFGAVNVVLPKSVDSSVSFLISLFTLVDLIIMIFIWRLTNNFKDEELKKWASLSVVFYTIIILINIIQGTFPLLKNTITIHVTGTGLPTTLIVFTIINFFTIKKSKKTLRSYS